MGRFFRTAKPTFIDDKMFQLPADLMYKTLLKNEKDIDTQYEKIDAFNETLKTDNLKTDDPAVNERLKQYRGKIDEYTDAILKKPLDYRAYQGKIANISRELQTELDSGLLGKAQEQYTGFNEEMKRVGELKNVSGEKKDLLKRAIQKKYSDQGGLNFQDENTYNAISDLYETPLEDVDTDALINTIGQGWEADQTATASAGATGTGYISTSSGRVKIRDAEDVARYVETSLAENGWEDQQRQMYKWKKEVGDIPSDANIDELIKKDKQPIIDQAKNKLGFRQETKDRRLTGDSVYMQKLAMRERQIAAKEGNIIEDKRDYRKTIKPDGTQKYSEADVQKFEGYNGKPGMRQKLEVLGRDLEIDNLDTFIDTYVKNGSLNDITNKLGDLGMTKEDVRQYINYQKDVEQQKTPHYPGYDQLTEEDKMNDPKTVVKQQAYLNSIVDAFNSMSPNDEVKSIKVWENGIPTETNFKTIAGLVESDKDYIYIPATGVDEDTILKQAPDETLLDADGAVIMGKEGTPYYGKAVKSLEQARAGGVDGLVSYDTKKVATYGGNDKLIQADAGKLKQNDNFEFLKEKEGPFKGRFSGKIDDSRELILTESYLKVNRKTGKKELITVDIVTDETDIRIK